MNIAAAFLSLVSLSLLGWWLYDVDWRLSASFALAILVSIYVSVSQSESLGGPPKDRTNW